MKRIFAVLLVLLSLCGCAADTAVKPVDTAVSVEAELVTARKEEADFTVSVSGGKVKDYGWTLYGADGETLNSGESRTADFTVTGLEAGNRYYLSVWAQVGRDKRLCDYQVIFESADRFDTPVAKGIDVSCWQEDIDWEKVASDGVDFVIMRIGFSGKTDRRFEEYYSGAVKAGLDVGVYFYSYAKSAEDAEEDARLALSQLGGRHLDYPVYYDIEDSSQFLLTSDEMTAMADSFCTVIEEGGYTAGVYTGGYMLEERFDEKSLIKNHEMWIAETTAEPPKTSNFQMLQYSHTGKVSGIDGDVDLDIAFVSYLNEGNA